MPLHPHQRAHLVTQASTAAALENKHQYKWLGASDMDRRQCLNGIKGNNNRTNRVGANNVKIQ